LFSSKNWVALCMCVHVYTCVCACVWVHMWIFVIYSGLHSIHHSLVALSKWPFAKHYKEVL
jgi:hypothetical protein